jgi:hypothetical protein
VVACATEKMILGRRVYSCANQECRLEFYRLDGKTIKLYDQVSDGFWGKVNFRPDGTNHYWPYDTPRQTLCGVKGTPGRETGSGMCRECQKRGAPTLKECEGCGATMKATDGRLCEWCSDMADTAATERGW